MFQNQEWKRSTFVFFMIVIIQSLRHLADHKKWFLHICEHCPSELVFNKAVYNWDIHFGAELVAMKHGIDALRGLRYKLRMMIVFITGPSYIYWNNTSIAHNISKLEPILRKRVIQFVTIDAMGKSLVGHIPSNKNATDLMIKVIYGQRQKYLVSNILYDTHNDH